MLNLVLRKVTGRIKRLIKIRNNLHFQILWVLENYNAAWIG